MMIALLLLAAATQDIAATKYYRTFSHQHAPLARIKPGDVIRTKTIDAGGLDENGERKHPEFGNPLTGPFYVQGAEPGDSIAVTLRKLRMNRNWGWTTYRLGLWALDPNYIEGIYRNTYKADLVHKGRDNVIPWDIDLEKKIVRLREPKSGRVSLEFPAHPMLGCIGVAAEGHFGPTSAISGPYGGNMDYNQIGEGATVMLPVYHPGALLFLGDGHALQADGEPTGTGIETSFEIEFSVELRKGKRLGNPRLENAEFIASIGSQPEFQSDLNRALEMATADMARWLVNEYDIEPWAAHLLIGYVGKYDVVTVDGSMALRIPKKHLPAKR